jgi:3-hydroxyisobutyrate dehydrogenase-like beta-hydroxyacid dehydrogenase
VRFIAAPVFGASPVAAEGKLLWVVAGPDDAVKVIEPYLVGVTGRAVIRLGEDVTKSSMLKTTGNFITAGMMELIAEAHVLAEKTGLGSDVLESLVEQQYGALALSMSKRLTTGTYMPAKGERPWSDLKLALKDVGHGVDVAREAGTRLEVGEVALGHLREADEYGDGIGRAMDSSALFGAVRRRAGLEFESDVVKKRDADV